VREAGVIHWSDIASQPIFSVTGSDGNEASLHWHDAQVYVQSDYGDDVQQAILALAEELQAMLVGDEGELYFTDAYEHPGTAERVPFRFREAGPQPRRSKQTRWWRRGDSNA
jgi:hypothetical protein